MKHLGTIELSKGILDKSGVGLWAFELDAGKEPRMYVDDTMMKLIGLEHQVSPEETYHAWYDHVDPAHYASVAASVEKMGAGIHSEVQYPWHHPDGHIMQVRCGGVRNPAYTAGVRIEGCHQDVTGIVHVEYERDQELAHMRFRSDALTYISDNELTPREFIEHFADRILSLVGCDQMIFRSMDGYSVTQSLPNTQEPDVNTCEQCPFSYPDSDLYNAGVIEMTDFSRGYRGFMPNEGCIVKAGYLQRINAHGRPAGVLTFHYLDEKHEFTEQQRQTFTLVGQLLGLMLERVEEKKSDIDQRRMERDRSDTVIEALSEEYDFVCICDAQTNEVDLLRVDERFAEVIEHIDRSLPTCRRLDSFFHEIILPEDMPKFRQDTERVSSMDSFAYARHKDVHFRARMNDGSVRYYALRMAVDMNHPQMVVMGLYDVDVATRAEMAAQQCTEEALEMAQAANKAKTTFLNNMSHDIRTPMNAIMGFTDMAINHIDDTVKVRDCLTKIGMSSDHLLSLINDILDMSRIESGKMHLTEKMENLSDIIDTLRGIIQPDIFRKKQEFSLSINNVHDEAIICDRLRLNQVLLNVLSNAIKYTDQGGRITLSVSEKAVSDRGFGAYEFKISDTGMGMDEAFLKTIYEPFTRVRSSTVSGIQGTGLGMAITKNIVDMMGGTIDITSQLGVGTEVTMCFDFMLAQKGENIENRAKKSELYYDFTGKRVLLVEDNPLNREIAEDVLIECGFMVDIAEDGTYAVEKMEQSEPGAYDIILMDVQMPLMDGYEATKRIRRLPKGVGDIPIIAMTANAFDEDRQNALRAGMNDHVSKPIQLPNLKSTLAKYLWEDK